MVNEFMAAVNGNAYKRIKGTQINLFTCNFTTAIWRDVARQTYFLTPTEGGSVQQHQEYEK